MILGVAKATAKMLRPRPISTLLGEVNLEALNAAFIGHGKLGEEPEG
jgi:hypothetical protein